jgi:hypothetical protein
MTPSSIDPARFLHEQLASASPDLLRHLLTTFINTLMSAETDALCGAEYGTSSPERVNTRNGYRHRDFDTRAGTLEVAIPKLRSGSYFPDWLLERRKRAEAALTSVVATCYLLGVSTRRMDKLVQALGITGLSKSQVSVTARDLDEHVASFRSRPLDTPLPRPRHPRQGPHHTDHGHHRRPTRPGDHTMTSPTPNPEPAGRVPVRQLDPFGRANQRRGNSGSDAPGCNPLLRVDLFEGIGVMLQGVKRKLPRLWLVAVIGSAAALISAVEAVAPASAMAITSLPSATPRSTTPRASSCPASRQTTSGTT